MVAGVDPSLVSVSHIAWNTESDVLALTLSGPDGDVLQLWHRSNYAWACKWERAPVAGLGRLAFLWDAEDPYVPPCCRRDGRCDCHLFATAVALLQSSPVMHTCVVVDRL